MTRVLVVDDQRIAREYMENIVRSSEGYELVGSLTKADMAATVCRRSAVELVLMDVYTHGRMDGIEAAAELREHFPKLKIICRPAGKPCRAAGAPRSQSRHAVQNGGVDSAGALRLCRR